MRISEIFKSRDRTFSFEFFPPKDARGAERLWRTAGKLRALAPSFVTVTYGAGGSTRRETFAIAGRLQREYGFEVMPHLALLGSTQDELRSMLEGLRDGSMENVLCVRGDPPQGEAHPVPTEGGFVHAYELVALARSLRHFTIAVAGYPEGHPEAESRDKDLEYLKLKLDAGADLVLTQLFFDNRDYFDFVARARRLGIRQRIIPGILPITDLKQVKRFTRLCGASIPGDLLERLEDVQDDPERLREVGVEQAVLQCRGLIDGGAPGIHFYTLNRSRAVEEVFRRARLG